MSVLLPAPFSPQRPCTSPGSTSSDTASSARTPGKSLVIPRTSSSGIWRRLYPSPNARVQDGVREAFSELLVATLLCAAPALAVALSPPATPAQAARTKLAALFDEEWEWRLRANPLFATAVGDHRFDDRLPSVALADRTARAEDRRRFRERLLSIDRTLLDDSER